MSEKTEGAAATALGAHSKDAQPDQTRSATGGKPAAAGNGNADKAANGNDATDGEGIIGKAKATAEQVGASAARLVDDLGETVARGGQDAYRKTGQAAAYVGDTVRAEPLAVLLGVGAIGFALGMMFARRY